jgi:hypothetical protein
VKAAHVRLCHSRMLFVRVYPRETQEMAFDAHDRAFTLFKGTCGRGIKDWVLPAAMERVRRKLAGADDGNRQMVDILTAVLTDGLPAVEAACAEATAQGVHSADVVLNILTATAILARPPRSSRRLL